MSGSTARARGLGEVIRATVEPLLKVAQQGRARRLRDGATFDDPPRIVDEPCVVTKA